MRAIQYIHTHILHRFITRETTRRRTVGQQMKQLKRSARTVEFVTRMTGEIKTERLVMVKYRRINGAIDEDEDRVRRRRDYS